MAIEFVGSASTGITAGFIAVTQTFSFATLTGGIAASPQTGDLVLVLRGSSDTITSLSVSGYTQLFQQGNIYTAYRFMGSTPETTLSLFTPANESSVTIVMVFRGVDQTTPLDAVIGTSNSTNGIPDPAAVTTVTNNAVSVILATSDRGPATVTSPTGYSASVVRRQNTDIAAYACYKTVVAAGVEDPSAFGGITSGINAAAAATIALRPAVSVASGNMKVWNGTSWVAKPVKVWNGSAWVTKPVKRWNGSAWVTTPY